MVIQFLEEPVQFVDPRASEPLDILLVEDSPADVRLTREALAEVGMPARLFVAEDGYRALAFLRREDEDAHFPRPGLVLLDLNLPRLDGFEVLRLIKTDRDLRRIPVLVLSTSQAEADIIRAYDLHANAFISKPVDLYQFIRVVRAIQDFWVGAVQRPPL